jgi:hypothetical protein
MAVGEFLSQRISIESVTAHPFEQVVSKFKSATTVRATTRLLTVIGLLKQDLPAKEVESTVRTFLSAFMILGHTTEVLHSHHQPIEMVPLHQSAHIFQALTSQARVFVTSLEYYLHTLHEDPSLPKLWSTYLSAFAEWKSHDSTILVEMLVEKFIDLDLMLLDIQESEAMAVVVEEYSAGIKSGQMLLLSKIRRLIGDDTRATVRSAVQAGRRRRTARLSQREAEPVVESMEEVGEIIDPLPSGVVTNRRIMHELALNPDYQIPAPTKTDEERQREDNFKDTFYNALLESLKHNDQSLLPTVINDIKHRLLSLLQPSTPSHTALSETLDETIIAQECHRNLFDVNNFVTYATNTMRQLCAPVRDADVTTIPAINGVDEVETMVLRLRRIPKVLGMMALDSANFHMRVARPGLVSHAIGYERAKFAEDLESGRVTLEKTIEWIEEAAAKVIQESSTSERPTAIQIWRRAYMDLLFSNQVPPETFHLDVDRLVTLRIKVRDVVTLAALILISKTFTAGNTSRPLDWSHLSSRLAILHSSSPESILAEIDRFIASPNIKRDLLLSMIRRIQNDARDPCVVLLERRVKAFLTTVLMGGEVRGLEGVGLGEVEESLRVLGKEFGGPGRVNWSCYREWYEDISGIYLERNSLGRNGD